jgi:hypothetical protein
VGIISKPLLQHRSQAIVVLFWKVNKECTRLDDGWQEDLRCATLKIRRDSRLGRQPEFKPGN